MSNIDLHELRNKLKFVHESQGVGKSTAMKLMQELDEARARGRKEWGRANKAEVRLDRLEQFLLVLADRHVRERREKRVPVFDEFDSPTQVEWVCIECGDEKPDFLKDKDCDRLREIKEFLGDTAR